MVMLEMARRLGDPNNGDLHFMLTDDDGESKQLHAMSSIITSRVSNLNRKSI